MQRQLSDMKRIAITAVATAAAMWILLYAPTPYVVYEPGIAVPVEPMIEAGQEQGGGASLPEGEGSFLLTAVKLEEPNFWGAITAYWDRDSDVLLKRDVFRGYTKKQYAERLSVIMEGSQNNAVEAAYRYLNLPYQTKVKAIVIADLLEGVRGGINEFQAGDKLIGINGAEPFESVEDMAAKLKAASNAGQVKIVVGRGGGRLVVPLGESVFSPGLTAERLPQLFGASGLIEHRGLEPADSSKRLSISAGEIGGPSAGLVFTLQAINLLTDGDLTGGSKIAATGTITSDGQVGPIGGIRQKVAITSREGAELFIVPSGNYDEAVEKAESIGAKMKIAGVRDLAEALEHIKAFHSTADNGRSR